MTDTDPVLARDLVRRANLERARQITARAVESAERERVMNAQLDDEAWAWAVAHPALNIFPGVRWTFLHRVIGAPGTVSALQVAVADAADPKHFRLLLRKDDRENVWVPQVSMSDTVPGGNAIGCRTLLQVHDAMETQRRRFSEEMSRD